MSTGRPAYDTQSEDMQRADDKQKGSYEEALKSLNEDYPSKIMFGIVEVKAIRHRLQKSAAYYDFSIERLS
ncbi:MAG: hypothetical protein Q8933_13895 [Bacteroidota bacterium]|nr:hypothetical protein [Bacteroidota bacterium]MDP4197779.1 hypothetical protein [Bacteroidota bacterium]